MATNPAFDAFFRDAAARLAQNRQIGPANPNPYAGSTFKPTEFNEAKKRETDWNLGQGIIDTLSAGTYAVAGIGARIGESVDKLAQGDFSNVAGDIIGNIPGSNFFGVEGGLFGAAGEGIQNKRTWSENLKDAGADDTTAAAAGLALDIALDPTWLIGGGLITAGVKGTASGIRATSAANKAGVKLSKEGYERVAAETSATSPLTFTEATTRPFTQTGELGPLTPAGNVIGRGWFQEQGKIGALSGDAFGNLLAGVRQGNVEAFANLKTAKAKAKAEKAELKEAKKAGLDKITKATTLSGDDAIRVTQPTEDLGTTIAKAEEEAFDTNPTTTPEEIATTIPTADSAPVVQQVTNTIEDIAKTSTKRKRKADIEKDANAVEEAVAVTTDAPSVYKAAREQVGALKQKYMDARGIKAVDADFATIKASEDAGKIAKAYDDMVSDPTNPAVINAYRQLAREVKDQYDYMVNELGIKVDFIDGDPYNVINAAGKSVPDSKLFMQDIMENKRLQVRGSAQDFAIDPHPLLSAEENDMFRAVHDFFGHAASGRGVAQNGEEAAWVSHSQMFSTEARKAMTTETRGQNSWSNTEGFGVDPITREQRFAQQKVGFLPDEYLITGPEREFLEQFGLKSNTLIGATGARLVEFADTLMYDLERVSSPTKNLQYTKAQLATFKKETAKILQKNEGYQPGSSVHKTLDGMLQLIARAIATPSQVKLGSASDSKLVTIADEAGIKETKNLSKGQGVNKTAGIIEPDLLTTRNLDEADELAEAALREADENVDIMGDFNAANVQSTAGETFTGDTNISLLGLLRGARESANQIADTTEVGLAARAMIEILDKPLDVTELVIAALKAEGKTLEVIKPFEPTFYGTSAKSYGKPNFSEEELRRIFPDDPLVTNANDLRHAMGKTPYRSTENVSRRIEKQQQLWAAFRQRNENTINQMELLEKENWQGQLTEFGDEIYQQFANGMIAKAGVMPTSIPVGVLTAHDGKLMTTLGKLIENLPKVRQPSRALPNKNRAVTINGKRTILENGSIPGVLQEYIIRKLTPEIAAAKNKPLSFGLQMDEDALIAEVYAKVGGLRAPSHAKLLVKGTTEDIAELSAKTFNKYYVPAKADPRTGMPQTGQLGYKLTHETEIMRDPATGYPVRVDKTGETPVPAKEATGIPDTQRLNVMTDENVPWFGRQKRAKGAPYAPQTGTGPQQLGVLQAVRESLKSISGAGATLSNSPDQAKLLTSVMTSLGIAVKETATPQQVFKQFQKEASLKFDEMVNGIEQAAKIESVALQTHRIFGGVGNSGDFLKMVDRLDPKTVQEAVVNFSDNALLSVDEYCKAQYALLNGLDDIIG